MGGPWMEGAQSACDLWRLQEERDEGLGEGPLPQPAEGQPPLRSQVPRHPPNISLHCPSHDITCCIMAKQTQTTSPCPCLGSPPPPPPSPASYRPAPLSPWMEGAWSACDCGDCRRKRTRGQRTRGQGRKTRCQRRRGRRRSCTCSSG